jgi:aminopeptidase N
VGSCGRMPLRRLATAVLVVTLLVAGACADNGGDVPERSDSSSGDDASAGGDESAAPAATEGGAPGVGDPYYPELGNGGYDVDHYTLDLRWDPEQGRLDGTTTIEATATDDLETFNLDLIGMEVDEVTVDDAAAESSRDGERELVVTPSESIGDGDEFVVEVRYGGEPEPVAGLLGGLGGWQADDGGEVYVASEPDGAATFFPVNDHPSDKAGYTIEVTVPEALDVVANGVGEEPETNDDGTRTWRFEQEQPMASYLVQVVIAELSFEESESPEGVPIRNAVDTDVADLAESFGNTGDMIDYYAELFGPYPFDVYGAAVVDEDLGFALETQTLSLFGSSFVDDVVIAHELAHMWFGDAVSLATWQDIWLNEGFAVYAEWLWTDHAAGGDGDLDQTALEYGASAGGFLDTPPLDPGADDLFNESVYYRGALTLHALRSTIGDDAFFELLQTWVETYGGSSATTADFEALAEEVSGEDLNELFDAWLRSDELPDVEDWLE